MSQTCDMPGSSENGTCGKGADYILTIDGKGRPLCFDHARPHFASENLHGKNFGEVTWDQLRDPAPSVVDPVIEVMPVSESVRPEPFPDEEPAEVRLKNAVLDLALAGCETLLDRLKSWRTR